ncbi:MAG: D-alanyl-D-alanine carboxypeptidase [Clostridiales bacterium]|nr:D-alanyl-D-alanine carboxypeptidase [Clostridiales bacterium]
MSKKKMCVYFLTPVIAVMLLIIALLYHQTLITHATNESEVTSRSSVVIERNSAKVLHDTNSHARHPIASVTKLMTVLLTLEKIDSNEISLEDKVLVSSNASGMGGSQIFLDADCEYVLGDLLKSIIVASANDSSVALAEYIAGSENNFVQMMNNKCRELGLIDTHYANCTGLPSAEGYSSAYDQAIILNRVLDYDTYHDYSSIWMEDFTHPSGRITQMTNTNKLSRFYEGCIGGKTGSTNEAKYCLAVGAKRNDMQIIAVVLGAENSKDRFKLASDLLNYGFENFTSKTIFSNNDLSDKIIKIKGMDRYTTLKAERDYTVVSNKNEDTNFSLSYHLPNMLTKVKENEVVGNVEIIVDGIVVDCINILSAETHDEASLWDYMKEIVKK